MPRNAEALPMIDDKVPRGIILKFLAHVSRGCGMKTSGNEIEPRQVRMCVV